MVDAWGIRVRTTDWSETDHEAVTNGVTMNGTSAPLVRQARQLAQNDLIFHRHIGLSGVAASGGRLSSMPWGSARFTLVEA